MHRRCALSHWQRRAGRLDTPQPDLVAQSLRCTETELDDEEKESEGSRTQQRNAKVKVVPLSPKQTLLKRAV